MRDVSKMRLLCSCFCNQYHSAADFYIDGDDPDERQLVVVYDHGGYRGAKEFVTGIRESWSDQDVMDLIMRPMKDPNAPHPAWEVPARAYGSYTLFAWWKGEEPE